MGNLEHGTGLSWATWNMVQGCHGQSKIWGKVVMGNLEHGVLLSWATWDIGHGC